MAEAELPQDVLTLAAAVAALPPEHRAKLERPMKAVLESSKRRKYLVFDLEATRRERDAMSH
jgi:hypothetical protein